MLAIRPNVAVSTGAFRSSCLELKEPPRRTKFMTQAACDPHIHTFAAARSRNDDDDVARREEEEVSSR